MALYSSAMQIATIDVGTSTAKLLIAEVDSESVVRSLYEEQRFVRIGAGVDATGRVGDAAMRRLRDALLAYQAISKEYGVSHIIVGATSASRDAENKIEIVEYVNRETGLEYEILSGEDEAKWSFAGTISTLDDLDTTCTVIDIGGGSTEFIVGDTAGNITFRRSLNVGSVRLTERFFSGLPPRGLEIERAEALIIRLLEESGVLLDSTMPFVVAGGSLEALALLHGGAPSFRELSGSNLSLQVHEVQRWRERVLMSTYDEVLAFDPIVMQGRADVFPAGVLILYTVMQRFGFSVCRVSFRGLRYGLALRFIGGDFSNTMS